MTITSERVVAAMKEVGMDQPTLAHALKVSQGSISKIVSGKTRNSRLMPRIATLLRKPLPYLLGESDDQVAGELAAPPSVRFVTMSVALPSELALAQMFDSFLDILDALPDKPDRGERARLLAQWLPIGLSQLHDLLPEPPSVTSPEIRKELVEALATGDRGRQQ